MKNATLILAAHGSDASPNLNRPFFELAERVGLQTGFEKVIPAFLQGEPQLSSCLHDVDSQNVFVQPLMTSNGYYSDVVFRRELERQKKPFQVITHLNAIGGHPRLPTLVWRRCLNFFETQMDVGDTSIVVVGHGTRKNKKSCLTTVQLVKAIRNLDSRLRVEFAFIDQKPNASLIGDRKKDCNTLIIPFLMGLGPHATTDVPQAFGIEPNGEPTCFPKIQHRGRTIVICDRPVGTYPELADLVTTTVSDAWQQLTLEKAS